MPRHQSSTIPLPQNLFHHTKLHPCPRPDSRSETSLTAKKSPRAFRKFPYCRRLPYYSAACARFRRARIVKSQLDTVTPTPIALAAQLIAVQDIITAAKTVRLARSEVVMLRSRLKALVDRVDAVRPVLVTDPFYLPSTFHVPTFLPQSLAPDKSSGQ